MFHFKILKIQSSTPLEKVTYLCFIDLLQVKVILKVCGDAVAPQNSPEDGQPASILNVDKKKKQIALYEPATVNVSTSDNADERKSSTSAPKMFAFDALFSDEDPQVSEENASFCFHF